MTYQGISKQELALLAQAAFERVQPLTIVYAARVLGSKVKAIKTLSRLSLKGRLVRVGKGKYFIVPFSAPHQAWGPPEYWVVRAIMGETPYYVGLNNMFNYWGFSDQISQTMFVLNTKFSGEKIIKGIRYKFMRIIPQKYYGVIKRKVGEEEVVISDRERTLVDLLDHFQAIGSFKEAVRIMLGNMKRLDVGKFVRYVARYPEIALRKRVGYIFEKKSIVGWQVIRRTVSGKKGRGIIVLNPERSSRKGEIDWKWRLILNDGIT